MRRRADAIRLLAQLERREGAEMCRLVIDAGIRVFQRKHRLGCCKRPRGQMRLVWSEVSKNDS